MGYSVMAVLSALMTVVFFLINADLPKEYYKGKKLRKLKQSDFKGYYVFGYGYLLS